MKKRYNFTAWQFKSTPTPTPTYTSILALHCLKSGNIMMRLIFAVLLSKQSPNQQKHIILQVCHIKIAEKVLKQWRTTAKPSKQTPIMQIPTMVYVNNLSDGISLKKHLKLVVWLSNQILIMQKHTKAQVQHQLLPINMSWRLKVTVN